VKLTIKTERINSEEFRGSFVEIPSIYYVAKTEDALVDRLMRLAHALESPNIKVDRILPDGDVVLVLDRSEDGEGDPTEYWEPIPVGNRSDLRLTA
jgi:hypothetical protein